jgi:phosphatidate cytidylyltransferase
MLKQRVITAVALLPLVILLVWGTPTWLLALVAGGLILVGTWEWLALSKINTLLSKFSNTTIVAALLYLLWLSRHDNLVLWVVALIALAWWLFALYWVIWWRREFQSWIKFVCGMLTLIPAWLAFLSLHASQDGVVKLLFLLALIWAADIAAYFAGKRLGKHKLAPKVSPGKTWEGVAGGSLALLLVSLMGVWLALPAQGYALILICLLTGWISIVGDLSESLFKRQAGLKDSGRLLPGHGGVLDRVDSLTAALPAFWLGLAIREWLR